MSLHNKALSIFIKQRNRTCIKQI